MSRSYKHTPRCGDTKGRHAKRLANHFVRRHQDRIPASRRGGYRKLYETWNICDYERVGDTFGAF